jgi:hypothetical protein
MADKYELAGLIVLTPKYTIHCFGRDYTMDMELEQHIATLLLPSDEVLCIYVKSYFFAWTGMGVLPHS